MSKLNSISIPLATNSQPFYFPYAENQEVKLRYTFKEKEPTEDILHPIQIPRPSYTNEHAASPYPYPIGTDLTKDTTEKSHQQYASPFNKGVPGRILTRFYYRMFIQD